MATLIAAIGGLTAAYGIIGLISPDSIKRFASRFHSRAGWYAGFISRLLFGALLLVAGPACRPDIPWVGWTVRTIGALAIIVAVLVIVLGPAKSLAALDWSLKRPSIFWRGLMLITFLIGGFLVYAGT